jgi:hypothetical protein
VSRVVHRTGPRYVDALRLLGADDSRVIAVADTLTGIAAKTVPLPGLSQLLSLHTEVTAYARRMLRGLRDQLTGIGRHTRTERIAAAHTIIVGVAYVEALRGIDVEQGTASRLAARIQRQLDSPVPMPGADLAFEAVVTGLLDFYRGFSYQGVDGDPDVLVAGQLAFAAVERYQELYRKLAVDVPEFALWANMTDHQATRQELRTGLAAIATLLAATRAGRDVDARRTELADRYARALTRPVLTIDEAPDGIVLPTLSEAYIDPCCRIATADSASRLAQDSWWSEQPLVSDTGRLLASYLTSPPAVEAPLLVLGQPGSGKSELTQMLAARLPANDFMSIRVELRAVPADASIQEQIERALYQDLGERLSWPDLSRGSGDALPVVLLDGFDELLQATGVSQADYLEKASEFQQREAELGRPVAVIITSRTVVADRVRVPEGCLVLRIEPFTDEQVGRWLDVWNRGNAARDRRLGLSPLTAEVALANPGLARQPLLLMMLALYDATDNALQRAPDGIENAQLYERLLSSFARREVQKHHRSLTPAQEDEEVETEMRRLGAVAIAIFNRAQQFVVERDLDYDLPYLLAPRELAERTAAGFEQPLSPSQLVVGRFFFVHESRAIRTTGEREASFEFLHATFQEFLVARSIVNGMLELADEHETRARRRHPGELDAGFFYALLSFSVISERTPTVDFTRDLLGQLTAEQRATCRQLLIDLLHDAHYAHPTWSFGDYEPVRLSLPRRSAKFSANLTLLVLLLSSAAFYAAELFPRWENPAIAWQQHARLWDAELRSEEFDNLRELIRVSWHEPNPPMIGPEDGSPVTLTSVFGAFRPLAKYQAIQVAADGYIGHSWRNHAFLHGWHWVVQSELSMAPYLEYVHGDHTFVDPRDVDTGLDTLAGILFRLRLSSVTTQSQETRAHLYTLLDLFLKKASPLGSAPDPRHLLYRQLREDSIDDPDFAAQMLTRLGHPDPLAADWFLDIYTTICRFHGLGRALDLLSKAETNSPTYVDWNAIRAALTPASAAESPDDPARDPDAP